MSIWRTDWEEYAVQMLRFEQFDALQTRLPITPLRPIIALKPNLKPEANDWVMAFGTWCSVRNKAEHKTQGRLKFFQTAFYLTN